jgi:general stress protein YciG
MAKNGGKRGFGAMTPDARRKAARKGGRQSGGNFKNDPERAADSGRKGGKRSSTNFAADRSRAADLGRKGGKAARKPTDKPRLD